MPAEIKVGDEVDYEGPFQNMIGGIVADKSTSPISGSKMIRVVDLPSEISDEDAGRWVYESRVIHCSSWDAAMDDCNVMETDA